MQRSHQMTLGQCPALGVFDLLRHLRSSSASSFVGPPTNGINAKKPPNDAWTMPSAWRLRSSSASSICGPVALCLCDSVAVWVCCFEFPVAPKRTCSVCVVLWVCGCVALLVCCTVPLWLCVSVALWLWCSVALWLSASVALWFCGSVALWLCASVVLFLCGHVVLWVCGSAALWPCCSVPL